MEKWIEYEVQIERGHVIKGKTLMSLKELKKLHREIGYKLISYNGRHVFLR